MAGDAARTGATAPGWGATAPGWGSRRVRGAGIGATGACGSRRTLLSRSRSLFALLVGADVVLALAVSAAIRATVTAAQAPTPDPESAVLAALVAAGLVAALAGVIEVTRATAHLRTALGPAALGRCRGPAGVPHMSWSVRVAVLLLGMAASPAHAAPLMSPMASPLVHTAPAAPATANGVTPDVADAMPPSALAAPGSASGSSRGAGAPDPRWHSTAPGADIALLASTREARSRAGDEAPAVPRGPEASVVVEPGECLWDIASRALGPGATTAQIAAHWPRWYAVNRAAIGPDPDLIRPGLRLIAPADGENR